MKVRLRNPVGACGAGLVLLVACSSDSGSNDGALQGAPGNMSTNNAVNSGAGMMTANPGGMTGSPGGMNANPGGMNANPGGMNANPGGMSNNPGGMSNNPGGMNNNPGGMMADTDGMMMADAGGMMMADAGLPDGGLPDADMADSAMPPASGGDNCLAGTGDFTSEGPYSVETTRVTIGSKGQFTIYYPDPLEDSCPHPLVVWGNGTLITGGTAYSHFQEHAASWGLISIASHDSNVGDGTFHGAAIEYMLAENEDQSSMFYGKLNGRVGVSGHSQGGAGADRSVAMSDAIEAVGNVQGSFGTPPDGVAFLCLTGTDDIATEGCRDAVNDTSSPALYANWDGADHVSTTLFEGEGSDEYLQLYSGWFRCFLADDSEACALFMGGEDAPVCQDSGWAGCFANNY